MQKYDRQTKYLLGPYFPGHKIGSLRTVGKCATELTVL